MNCIFCCVFNQEKYVDMFLLLLESIVIYGNINENIHILVYTTTEFMNIIKNSDYFCNNIIFEINNEYDNIDKACKSRLNLFNLHRVSNYEKILYLDTDILIKGDINKVFSLCSEDILYVLEEGTIDDKRDFYGLTLFGNTFNNYRDKTAFTSGILLFNNCDTIRNLFKTINEDIIKRPHNFSCYDQPYIVYNAFKKNLYNNKILKLLAVNNDENIYSDKIIHHFPGYPGIYTKKMNVMTSFLHKLNNNNFSSGLKIYNSNTLIKYDSVISLIGICISYKYFDTLKFMLPINYPHFQKLYIVTQEDDIETINFCKQFDNVVILFYNFINNNKKFDKYGALNYAQKQIYNNHPESWYLIIDSDIILPNNFVSILIKEKLDVNCLYGAIRINVLKSSELLDKQNIINKNIDWKYNNILCLKNKPPSILGCFQLYKKKVFCRNDLNNAGKGDYFFGYDNFDIFCNLQNIVYFHLGKNGVNWNGKVESFIDDIKISSDDLYYDCHKKTNNCYYNKLCQLVKYGNSMNIDNDVWTCSEKMRYDIYDFFKNKSHFRIAELGSHKGYTTRILSNIFSYVYSVDNSATCINFNKNFNKLQRNVEYVNLDIYNNSWEALPDNIEVTFIDALHTYEACKSDIINSLKRFTNLQYIVFDDYGVWKGVKKAVDEFMNNGRLVFERFIGINNVPGPKGLIYKNVNEGIICRVNKNIINKTIIPIKTNKNNIRNKILKSNNNTTINKNVIKRINMIFK
jgi:hypothetical protein